MEQYSIIRFKVVAQIIKQTVNTLNTSRAHFRCNWMTKEITIYGIETYNFSLAEDGLFNVVYAVEGNTNAMIRFDKNNVEQFWFMRPD